MSKEIDINSLRELHAATTQGEWYHTGGDCVWPTLDEKGYEAIADTNCDLSDRENRANAAFIAASHNAMPALLDELERLRGQLEARENWVVHNPELIPGRNVWHQFLEDALDRTSEGDFLPATFTQIMMKHQRDCSIVRENELRDHLSKLQSRMAESIESRERRGATE